jgi:tRNA (mo5U34)-methyltransferase
MIAPIVFATICPMTVDIEPHWGPYTRGELLAEIAKVPWFHCVDLGGGIVTPGTDSPGPVKLAFNKLPESLAGKTVLDIGAWDGYFSFEAERRRAARVLATDSYIWEGKGWGSKAGFELARRALGSRVEDLTIDVMDLSPERVGVWDVALFLGVLYHLRHPLYALERVASVTREMLILSTSIDMVSHERPAMAFYPGAELGNDPTNWWGPNIPCVHAMLHDVGFRKITTVTVNNHTDPDAPLIRHVAAFHAWK